MLDQSLIQTTPEPIELLSQENPRSLYNLVSTQMQYAINKAREKEPDLFIEDEQVLKQTLRSRGQTPTPADNRMRINLWQEYERTQASGKKAMVMGNIHAGVCITEYFYQRVLKRPEKIAWLLAPPSNYVTATKEALLFGIEGLREILDEPNHDAKGRLNTRLLDIKLKIVDLLDKRILGAIPQKVLNLHAKVPSEKTVNQYSAHNEMNRLNKRLKELERRDRLRIREKKKEEEEDA